MHLQEVEPARFPGPRTVPSGAACNIMCAIEEQYCAK